MWKTWVPVDFKSFIRAYVTLLMSGYLCANCNRIENNTSYIINTGRFEYDLASPDRNYELPDKLREISGLDNLNEQIHLCVEDEKGILYFFDMRSGKIVREIDFGRSGDFEGVAHIGQTAYVIQSDGDLFFFPMDGGDKLEAEKLSTALKSTNNVEGLSPGHIENTLYIACKGDPEINDNKLEGRAVYLFDLDRKEIRTEPYIHLTSDLFNQKLIENNLSPYAHMPFKPSGIAIHPVTRDVFLIASVGKLLVILSPEGEIESMVPLLRNVLSQPEGICFDPEGNLYISSEARRGKGYIKRFNRRISKQGMN